MKDAESKGEQASIISIDEAAVKFKLSEMLRGTVEETLNAMLDVEADQLLKAKKYQRTQERRDTRAGHYQRSL